MVVLGVVLIIVGAMVAYFINGQLGRAGGLIIFAAGVLFLILGVLDTSDVDTAMVRLL